MWLVYFIQHIILQDPILNEMQIGNFNPSTNPSTNRC